MRIAVVILCVLIIITSSSVSSAQAKVTRWVYVVTSQKNPLYTPQSLWVTQIVYQVWRISTADRKIERVFDLPAAPNGTFGTLMPKDEYDTAVKYLTQVALYKAETEETAKALLGRLEVNSSIQAIRVAPNNQDVALVIVYRRCLHPGETVCFGVSKITLVSEKDKTVKNLLDISFHTTDKRYLVPDCRAFPLTRWYEVTTQDIDWTYKNDTILIGINNWESCGRTQAKPVVAVPLSAKFAPFVLVPDSLGWAVSPDSYGIGTVVNRSHPHSSDYEMLSFTKFEPDSQSVSENIYSPGEKWIHWPNAPIWLNQSLVAFGLSTTGLELAFRSVVLAPEKFYFLMRSDDYIPLSAIRASRDGKVAVAEDRDGYLWHMVIDSDHVHFPARIVPKPVAFWRWGPDRLLLVQFKGDTVYSILNEKGELIDQIDILNQIKTRENNTELVFVDW